MLIAVVAARPHIVRCALQGHDLKTVLGSVVGGAVLVAAPSGWLLQRHYLEHRYVAGLPDSVVHRQFVGVRNADVDGLGVVESYPMFGPDLSNEVTVFVDEFALANTPPPQPCRYWRRAVSKDPGYIVVMDAPFRRPIPSSERGRWFADDPSVTVLVGRSDVSVYYHDAALDPAGC